MFIINNRKIFFFISAILIVASIATFVVFGFNLGTDFRGGSILEVSFQNERPTIEEVKETLGTLELGNYSVRTSGEANVVIRTEELSQEAKNEIITALAKGDAGSVNEERFNSVGPIVGESLKKKSYVAISVVLLGIVLFITFAFRKVSKPVSSWKYGLTAIISLVHDVIIPAGAYIIAGQIFGWEIDLLFVTALLAILGYSVHDTIVVFDRVRERLRTNEEYNKHEEFDVVVGGSLMDTMGRSINTSLTLVFTLAALFILGSGATQSFTFTLLIGVIVGAYSSIFIGTPLLVTLEKFQKKK